MQVITITVDDGINGPREVTVRCPKEYDPEEIGQDDLIYDCDIQVIDRLYLTEEGREQLEAWGLDEDCNPV